MSNKQNKKGEDIKCLEEGFYNDAYSIICKKALIGTVIEFIEKIDKRLDGLNRVSLENLEKHELRYLIQSIIKARNSLETGLINTKYLFETL